MRSSPLEYAQEKIDEESTRKLLEYTAEKVRLDIKKRHSNFNPSLIQKQFELGRTKFGLDIEYTDLNIACKAYGFARNTLEYTVKKLGLRQSWTVSEVSRRFQQHPGL